MVCERLGALVVPRPQSRLAMARRGETTHKRLSRRIVLLQVIHLAILLLEGRTQYVLARMSYKHHHESEQG